MKNQVVTAKTTFIIAFTSTNFSLKLYKILKEKKYKVEMIATPCRISAGCSRSLAVEGNYISLVIDEINNHGIIIQGIYRKVVRNGRYVYEAVNLDDIK